MNGDDSMICLFIDNQWKVIKKPKEVPMIEIVGFYLGNSYCFVDIFKILTAMPVRILEDKDQKDNKRLIKTLKRLI